jgi:hypothetical protein
MVYSCAASGGRFDPLNIERIEERRIEPVTAQRRKSARIRAGVSLGLCFIVLLAGPGRVAAQERLFPVSPDHGWPAASELPELKGSFPVYRLLPEASRDHEAWMSSADPGTDTRLTQATESESATDACSTRRVLSGDSSECEQRIAFAEALQQDLAETGLPKSEFLERHRVLFSTLIPITSILAVTANSLVGYDTNHSFRIHHEGWFGEKTTNGGADKASHMADYYVITSLFEDVYRILGWSERAAILWGFSIAFATGLANEVSDGFTRHGFSWEDLGADTIGAGASALVALTRTRDLFSMRTSHLPGSTYTHDVYAADLKLNGVGQRLNLNIGPLKWLLLSATYQATGYRVSPPTDKERLIGIEIGLNLQQILNDVGVKKDTWWGFGLHLFADNIRFPYTAIGMRYDLNKGKWHGPNAGNYD